MFKHPLRAYEQASKPVLEGRDLEAATLMKAASLLNDCYDNWDRCAGSSSLSEGLKFNQKIWTIFQAEIENPENPLPRELKLNLIRLISFIDRRTFELLADPSREKLQILININRNIAAGLSHSPSHA